MSIDTIKSPNITFRETDLSQVFVPQPSSDFVVIGTTPKGTYFVPTTISSYAEYQEMFGGVTREEYTGLTVKDLLREEDTVTVVPVASAVSYDAKKAFDLVVTEGSSSFTVAQLFLSLSGSSASVDEVNVTGQADDFALSFSSSTAGISGFTVSNLSVYKSDSARCVANYTNPKSKTSAFYVKYFVDVNDAFSGSADTPLAESTLSITETSANVTMSAYKSGETPWVISQFFNSTENHELFKFQTIQQGDSANRTVKIQIGNLRTAESVNPSEPTYGTFDVFVRRYGDSDLQPEVLERFVNVNLDPTSNRYIARVIGDQNVYFDSSTSQIVDDGIYPNKSRYIRVVMADVEYPTFALPYGFQRYDFASTFFNDATVMYRDVDVTSDFVAGFDFSKTYADYLHKEIPLGSSLLDLHVGNTDAFLLSSSNAFLENNAIEASAKSFVFGFQYATDGFNPTVVKNVGLDMTANNTFGLDFSSTSGSGYVSFKRALDIVNDNENIKFKFLSMPAVNLNLHGNVVQYALDMAKGKQRGDIVVLLDAGLPDDTVGDLESLTVSYDSSYGATYDPWYYISDNELGVTLVPISVLVPSAFAYTRRTSRLWFGTFGYNRGRLETGLRPYRKRSINDRDKLSDARINPVARMVGESSATILGNSTLQLRRTALSNINVRLLLNEAKTFIREIGKKYIAQPYTDILVGQLTDEVTQYFTTVQQESGVEDFRVDFSEAVNTDDDRDLAILNGVIYLRPTQSLRGIAVNFVITRSGVDFSE